MTINFTTGNASDHSPIGAQFAASLTHAFGSRLNAVLGSLEMVSQTNLSGEQARFVGTAIVAQQLEELCLAGGALESWHACRNRLVQIGRMTLTEVANWLDADAGCVRLLQP